MKLVNWIQLSALIFLIGTGIIYSQFERWQLSKCSFEHPAVIFDKYKSRKSGRFFRYKYVFENKEYSFSQKITSEYPPNKVLLGDTIKIYVSCNYPSISKVKPLMQ